MHKKQKNASLVEWDKASEDVNTSHGKRDIPAETDWTSPVGIFIQPSETATNAQGRFVFQQPRHPTGGGRSSRFGRPIWFGRRRLPC